MCVSMASPNRVALLLAPVITGGCSNIERNSHGGGLCCRSHWDRTNLQVESRRQRHQCAERWIRLLGRKQPPDCLRLHACSPSELRFREMEFLPASVERLYDGVDLIYPITSLAVCLPVLCVLQATCEVALGAAGCRIHGNNVSVTRKLRLVCTCSHRSDRAQTIAR